MASHRRPKQPSRARVTVLTATAAAAVALTSQAAHADPKPTKSEVKAKLDPSVQLLLSSDPDSFLDQASALDQSAPAGPRETASNSATRHRHRRSAPPPSRLRAPGWACRTSVQRPVPAPSTARV